MLGFMLLIPEFFNDINTAIGILLNNYSYAGAFLLMFLESASLPVPSEVVLPLVGLFVARGYMQFYPALAVVVVGGLLGMYLDYYIAYYAGKKFVYESRYFPKRMRRRIAELDVWFSQNGTFAVFVSRLIPVIRGLISFPAGFSEMKMSDFLLASFFGSVIWDTILIQFGYYALPTADATTLIFFIAGFAIVLYFVYVVSSRYIKRKTKA